MRPHIWIVAGDFVIDQSPHLMQVKDYVAERLKDRVGAHDFNHILRVYDWCMKIGAELNADLEILGLAALLHDIIRPEGFESNHATESAVEADRCLKKIGYPDEKIEEVIATIKTHRGLNPQDSTLEAKILWDADKLEAVGAVTIARTFWSRGALGLSIEDGLKTIETRWSKVKDMMHTEIARKEAEKRHKFMMVFIQEMRQEIANSQSEK